MGQVTPAQSIAARIRALAAHYEPDCGEPQCEDCAAVRELLACAAACDVVAGELRTRAARRFRRSEYDEPEPFSGWANEDDLTAWADALADAKEGAL